MYIYPIFYVAWADFTSSEELCALVKESYTSNTLELQVLFTDQDTHRPVGTATVGLAVMVEQGCNIIRQVEYYYAYTSIEPVY